MAKKIFDIKDGVLRKYNGEDREVVIPEDVKYIAPAGSCAEGCAKRHKLRFEAL